jgi:hypothetical protein
VHDGVAHGLVDVVLVVLVAPFVVLGFDRVWCWMCVSGTDSSRRRLCARACVLQGCSLPAPHQSALPPLSPIPQTHRSAVGSAMSSSLDWFACVYVCGDDRGGTNEREHSHLPQTRCPRTRAHAPPLIIARLPSPHEKTGIYTAIPPFSSFIYLPLHLTVGKIPGDTPPRLSIAKLVDPLIIRSYVCDSLIRLIYIFASCVSQYTAFAV